MTDMEELHHRHLLRVTLLLVLADLNQGRGRSQVKATKMPLLRKAAERLLGQPEFGGLKSEMEAWRKRNQWVEESALFYALANLEEGLAGTPWWTWPEPIRSSPSPSLLPMPPSVPFP